MGAPVLTSVATSAMPMTGLDFLAQRAGVARAGVGGLTADHVRAEPLGAQSTVRTSGLDLLKARVLVAAPTPTGTATSLSWAAVHMGSTMATAASERRRAAGLSILPEGGEQRDAMAARLHEALGHGYAPSTRLADEGY